MYELRNQRRSIYSLLYKVIISRSIRPLSLQFQEFISTQNEQFKGVNKTLVFIILSTLNGVQLICAFKVSKNRWADRSFRIDHIVCLSSRRSHIFGSTEAGQKAVEVSNPVGIPNHRIILFDRSIVQMPKEVG